MMFFWLLILFIYIEVIKFCFGCLFVEFVIYGGGGGGDFIIIFVMVEYIFFVEKVVCY